MAQKPSFGLPVTLLLLASLGAAGAQGLSSASKSTTQASPPSSRLAGDWRSTGMVTVPIGKPPLARTGTDQGAAPPAQRLDRMLLLLAPSAAQQQALTAELSDLQNPSSPDYHHWLSPTTFADKYSNSAADVTAVSEWLQSQGLEPAPLPAGRGWVEFSGTVAQVEQAFHATIHSVATTAGTRSVLTGDISVPAAFKPIVYGLVSLDGTLSSAALTTPQPVAISVAELAAKTSLSGAESLTPQLAAQLLHLDQLQSAAITGTGESIAIATRSNINSTDVAAFRLSFGLPAMPLKIVANGPDPGLAPNQQVDQSAATLTASWAGAAAPGAQIILIPAATATATDGLDLSLAAIIDQAVAHTVAIGYSSCEAALSQAHQNFYSALYRQAAAEGIAIIAAAGDSGSSACHAAGSSALVSSGYGVNALASTPWNTVVGVAALSPTSPATGALAAWSPASIADPAYASGGGLSTLYSSPGWQPLPARSAPGVAVTAVHNRQLPDLALPTAIDSSINPGLAFCLSASPSFSGCNLMRAGGSSASAAIFAGIAALVAQKNGPQGNLAPNLYMLSRQSGVFSDVAEGTAQLACVAGSPGCSPTQQIGFTASAGYDLATGLGVPDAHALVENWATPAVSGTGLANVTNNIGSGQTINPSGSLTLAASVSSGTGGPAPTGTVLFYDQATNTTVATVSLLPGSGVVSTASGTITGVLAQGGHPIEGDYSGDSVYAPQTSLPVVVEVEPSSTATVVAPATLTPNPGSSLLVTATVTAANAGVGALSPSGTVDFRLDGVSQGTMAVTAGPSSGSSTVANSSITISVPWIAGNHQIVGFYSGDSNYTNSTSTAAGIAVTTSVPTVVLTPSSLTPLAGSSLQLTVAITPPVSGATPASGVVSFTLDGTAIGVAAVTTQSPSSSASLSISAPSAGAHTLLATYQGDTNYSPSTSAAVTITVSKTPTTLAVTPSTSTPSAGSQLQLTATVTPSIASTAVPSGTVTFTLDGVTAGAANVTAGTSATLTITAPAAGTHTLQATYSGDTNFSSSLSPSIALTVPKTTTTLVATPSTTTSTVGSPVQVAATITPTSYGSAQPTGNVTFTVDGVSAGIETVVAGHPSTAGITLSTLSPGAHVVQTSYSGDTNYGGSTAPAVTITVSKSPSAVVIVPSTLTPTAGGSMLVTASVTSTNPGSTLPTGTVTITLDGVVAGTGPVTTGAANIIIPLITAGTHILGGTYSGDTSYSASTASTVSVAAARGATITTVTATPAILAAGTAETLTATIAPLNPLIGTTYTFTGTVSFYDGGSTLLGTAQVSASTAAIAGITLSNNIAHSITAIYTGDLNWLGGTSAALTLSASTLPDTVILTSNYSVVQPGAAIVLMATVTPGVTPPATAETNPTGIVVFYYGTTIIGQATLVPVLSGDTATATLTTQSLPGGQDTLTAYYKGDLYFSAATSNALSLNVEDFTVTPASSNPAGNLNIIQGSSGSASFVITGAGGFNNQVQVLCAVPAQDNMTCTASPQQVVPTASVTFVVQTFTSGSGTTASQNEQKPLWPRAAGGAALAVLLGFFLVPFGRRSTRRLLVLLLLLAGLSGAGIGCTSGVHSVNSGTPLGVATLKITATAYVDNTVVSHAVYLTVNVLPKSSAQ